MPHASYVKVGRLVRVRRGPRQDKVGVITAIVDANRDLGENSSDDKVYGPLQNLKNDAPLQKAVDIHANASTTQVKKALEAKKSLDKYSKTTGAKAIVAKQALAASTDFERHQLRVAKRSRAHWSRKVFAEMDTKQKISWHSQKAAKLEKVHKKFEGKKMKERHERIKTYFKNLKAKKAKQGKKTGKK